MVKEEVLLGLDDPGKRLGYRALASWVSALGLFLMMAPHWFFGPSWSYFAEHGQRIPPGGLGMGGCLFGIGVAQLVAVWLRCERTLPVLFFMSAFVFWVSGFLLGAEGLVGHQGLMEAPFMVALGVHKFYLMANAWVDYKEKRGSVNGALR